MLVDQFPFITKRSRFLYVIEPGTHEIDQPIELPPMVSLHGLRGSELIGARNAWEIILCRGDNKLSGIRTKNGSIGCFVASHARPITISDCKFDDAEQTGIWCETQSQVVMDNVILGSAGDNGIQVQGSKSLTLRNCLAVGQYGNKAIDVVHFTVEKMTMIHCTIVSKTGYGVRLKNIANLTLGNNLVICPQQPGAGNGYAFQIENGGATQFNGNAGVGPSSIPLKSVPVMFMSETASSAMHRLRPLEGVADHGAMEYFETLDLSYTARLAQRITSGCLQSKRLDGTIVS